MVIKAYFVKGAAGWVRWWNTADVTMTFRCKKTKQKTNKQENSVCIVLSLRKQSLWSRKRAGRARVRGRPGKGASQDLKLISVPYCPPFTSAGIFLKVENALKGENVRDEPSNVSKLIVKFAFFSYGSMSLFYSVYTFILCAAHVTKKCTINIVEHRRRRIMSRQS